MNINIISDEYRHNSYSIFKHLRQRNVVCRTEPYGHWMVANYEDVQNILKNSHDFSSSQIVTEPEVTNLEFFLHSRGLVGSDPPHHTRLRRILSKAFTPSTIRNLEQTIREICQKLINQFRFNDVVNIVDDYAAPLPIMFIACFLGIDKGNHAEFKSWINLLLNWQKQGKTKHVLLTAKSMFNYFKKIIDHKKTQPGSDLISRLITAKDNNIITDAEVLAMVRLLFVAGTDTTTNLIANGIYLLATKPELIQQLKDQPILINNFIEELLRLDSPVMSLMRRVNNDVSIGKTRIKKGEIVLPLIASANHDERIFQHPEKFDLNRQSTPHLTFGDGRHYCIGSQLARLQARIAFEELLLAFNQIELDPDTRVEYNDSFFFRGCKTMCLNVIKR